MSGQGDRSKSAVTQWTGGQGDRHPSIQSAVTLRLKDPEGGHSHDRHRVDSDLT